MNTNSPATVAPQYAPEPDLLAKGSNIVVASYRGVDILWNSRWNNYRVVVGTPRNETTYVFFSVTDAQRMIDRIRPSLWTRVKRALTA